MLRTSLLFIFLVSTSWTILSQSGVQLKDIHHSAVTDAVVIENRNEIYTSDQSGKVLIYDLDTGDYKGIFKKADNQYISLMYSINDSTLTTVKSYTIENHAIDSLHFYDLNDRSFLKKVGITSSLSRKRNENYISLASRKQFDNSLAIVKADPFEQIGVFKTAKKVVETSFSPNGQELVYVQSVGVNGYNELVLSDFAGNVLNKQDLSETMATYHLLFESNETFLLFSKTRDQEDLVTVHRFNTQDLSSEKVFEVESGGMNWRLEVDESGDHWLYFPTFQSGSSSAISGRLDKSKYVIERIEFSQPFNYVSPLKDQKLIGFTKKEWYQENSNSHYIYNLKKRSSHSKGRPVLNSENKAFFLGNGDYLLTEYRSFTPNLRYFPANTLQNKYGKLHFKDWLELNKGMRLSSRFFYPYQMDLANSSISFTAEIDGEIRAIGYNLETDNYSFISPALNGLEHVIGYSEEKQVSVILNSNFSLAENPSLRTVKICEADQCQQLKGEFRDIVLSRNGEYVATISADFLFELRLVDGLEVLKTEQFTEKNRYKIHAVLDAGFSVSVSPPFDYNNCTEHVLFYAMNDKNLWNKETQDCFKLEIFDFKENYGAVYVENLGLVIGEDVVQLDSSHKISNLSLSPDKKRVFVSFADGQIQLYDIESKETLVDWILPSFQDQLIVGKSGRFLANFDASDYLVARGSSPASINEFNDPIKVLSDMGEVDKEFLAAVQKAKKAVSKKDPVSKSSGQISRFLLNGEDVAETDILNNRLSFQTSLPLDRIQVKMNNVAIPSLRITKLEGLYSLDFEVSEPHNLVAIADQETGAVLFEQDIIYKGPELKPELHVLAIGVSRYEQQENNLTFADKDALDLSRFYGEIADQEIQNYYDEFYASPLHIEDLNGKKKYSTLNHFLFNSYGIDLTYAGGNGRYWYRYDSSLEQTFLYDFEKSTVKEMNLPSPTEIESVMYRRSGVPTSGGFFFRAFEKLHFYSFSSNSYEVVNATIPNEKIFFGNAILLDNGKWVDINAFYNGLDDNEVTVEYYASQDPEIKKYHIQNENALTFITTSNDAEIYLFKDWNDILYLYKLVEGKMSLLTSTESVELQSLDNFHISAQDKTITKYSDQFVGDRRVFSYQVFDYSFKELNRKEIEIDSELLLDVVIDQGQLYQLKKGKPLADPARLGWFTKADAFAKAEKTSSFSKTHVSYLLNEDATQEKIQQELASLKGEVRPQDQVVVFFAGHGVLDEKLNYYYAPQDMDFKNVQSKGVSFDSIVDSMIDTGSRKLLLLMDTCHSGNTLDMDDYEITQEKGENGERGGVSRRTKGKKTDVKVSDVVTTLFNNSLSASGVTVLSASSGQDVAYESDELSNGAFTTAFLSQLKSGLSGSYSIDPDYSKSLELNPRFIDELRVKILQLTSNKQEMDIRETNKKATIKLW
jgi:hypothetical protein